MAKLVFVIFAVLLIGVLGQDEGNSTAAPETTTPQPATTTPAPTPPPTTAAPPTPTPHPSPDEFYRVTEDNVTCVMYGGDVSFSVSYAQTSGKSGTATVKVPQPGNDDAHSTGSCNASVSGIQFINITWGPTNTMSSFQLQFNSTDSNNKWMLINVDAKIFLDETTFHNATDAGRYLTVSGEFPGLNNVAVDTNSSLVCRAAVGSTNFTALVNATSAPGYTVTGNAVGIKLQAFNSIPNMKDLQQGMRCEADITSDLVPIAVGCALAGLVLLVLISYLVGRRRRAAAYQSV